VRAAGREWRIVVDADDVLAGQGIDPAGGSTRLPALRAVAALAVEHGVPLLTPRVALERVAVTSSDASAVQLEGGVGLEGAAVARRLAGATEALVAVCTVGEAIGREASALMARDPVLALALEGLGCAAVDRLASDVCQRVRDDAAREGLRATAPLSPGMEAWPLLEGQRAVFRVVDADRIGVRLSESGQMQPCKSLSLVVGLGAAVEAGEGASCDRCGARRGCRWSVRRGRSSGGQ
jgi:hypothetical protein